MAAGNERIPFDIEKPDYKPEPQIERPIDDLRAAGFNDDEISQWTTEKRATLKEAGFEDSDVDAYLTGGVKVAREPSKGLMQRLTDSKDRVFEANYKGFKEGFGSEPLGLSLETTEWMADKGVMQKPGDPYFSKEKSTTQNLMGGVRLVGDSVINPVATGFEALGRGFNALLQGGAETGGQVLQEVGLANEAEGKRASRDFYVMGQMAALMEGQPYTATRSLPGGKITEVPVGTLPKSEDFASAAKVVGGESAPRATQEKLLKLYEEKGLHPAEVADDALNDPTVRQSLLSSGADDLPAKYGSQKQDAPVEAPKGQETPSREIDPAIQPIFEDVKGQLKAAGMDEAEAAANAEIVAARYRTRAARLGDDVEPAELYRSEGVNISNADASVDSLKAMIERKATPEEISSHPIVRDARAQTDLRPQTKNLEGFGTPEFEQSRKFNFDGEQVQGYDEAVKRLEQKAASYTDEVLPNREATIVIGPPASGKSTISERIAAEKKAAIIDPDDVKPALPEYEGGIGASAVHEESSLISSRVLKNAMRRGDNIVLPRTGGDIESIRGRIDALEGAGYKVNLVNLTVDQGEAYRRMVNRFLDTGRIVGHEYFSATGIKPRENFYQLLNERKFNEAIDFDGSGPVPNPLLGQETAIAKSFTEPGRSHQPVRPAGDAGSGSRVPEQAAPAEVAPIQSAIPNSVQSFTPAELKVDAKRFQFKEGGDETGVTERLKGVKQWDPIKAGMVLVWEDKAGQRFIVDGHQRYGLAQRIANDNPAQNPQLLARVMKEADGVTDAEARTVAALKNIAEGTGTAVDAAKVLRESPTRAGELPPRSELFRQAQGLVNLSDDAFRMVINDVVPPKYAAIVGRLVPEEAEMQGALLKLLNKTEPANSVQAEAIVRQGIEAGLAKKEKSAQSGLFGEEDVAESLYIERAKVLDKAIKSLAQDKKIFAVLTKEQNSIEAAGNKLASEVNQKRTAADAHAIHIIQTLANRTGPVSDALNLAAKQARADGKFSKAVGGFVDEIRAVVGRDDFAGLSNGGKRSAAHAANENTSGVGFSPELTVDRASNEAMALFQSAKDDGRQMELAGAGKVSQGVQAQRLADQPLKGKVAQNRNMDEGLFGDSSAQKELFQPGPRGKITLDNNRATIELFQHADESTFMHESSHLWLDELIRDATGTRATDALRKDLETTLKWLDVDDVRLLGRAEHEKWAKGFETYLATGKAPSTALEKAFDSFKQWLTDIYHSLTGAGVKVPDDIRGVMDRLLATDDEIASAVEQAQRKILDQIDIGGKDRRAPIDFDRLYTMAIDDLHPLNQATHEMGGSALTGDNPYKVARLARGAMGKSEFMMENSTFDFHTLKNNGEGLKKVLEPVKRDLNGLRAYADARRAMELEGRGIKTGFDMEAAKVVVGDKKMQAKFEPVFQKLIGYQDRLVDYLRDSGIIDEKAQKAMREANKNYVPFYALMDDSTEAGGLFAGMNVRNPIKRIMGSTRKKIDPIEGIIKNTITYTKMAEDNRAGLAFMKLADESGKAGELYERVKPSIVSTKIQKSEMEKFLTDNGITDAPDSMLTVFRAKHQPLGKDEIAVFEAGKRQVLRLDPELAAAFKALDAEDVNMFVKLLAIPARGLRAGATLTFEFMGRNMVRDFFTATTTSKGVFTPVDSVKGLMSYIKKDKDYEAFVKSGGANAAMVSLDRRYLQENLRKMTQDSGLMSRAFNVVLPPQAADMATKLFNIPAHPIASLRMVSELAENATRLAEFKKVMRQGEKAGLEYSENAMRAGFAAREVTLDFARAGSKARAWNMIDAFFNASLQGTDRIIRAFREKPMATSAKIFGGITTPSVLLWAANHDDPRYKEIPQWQKDLFWIVMTDKWEDVSASQAGTMPAHLVRQSADGRWQQNNGHIYRIPKPFEVGVLFGSGAERLLDAMYDKNPDAFKGFASTIYGAVVPNMVPTAVQPIVDQYSNKSMFTGRGLIPAGLEGQLPEYQYTPYTTELAKSLGSLISSFPGVREASIDNSGVTSGVAAAATSPILIENYLRAWTGGLGQYMLGIADKSLRTAGVLPDPVVPTATLADIPVIRAFVVRYPTATTQSIQDFYDGYERNKKFYDTWMAKAKEGDEQALGVIQKAGGPQMFVQLDGIKQALGEHSRLINDIYKDPQMKADEKRQLIDSLYYSMIEIGKAGKETLQQVNVEAK